MWTDGKIWGKDNAKKKRKTTPVQNSNSVIVQDRNSKCFTWYDNGEENEDLSFLCSVGFNSNGEKFDGEEKDGESNNFE